MNKPLSLLIIEDDNAVGETLASGLSRYGFHCEIRQTMRGALHLLHSYRPEAIIADLMLPDSLSPQTIEAFSLLNEYCCVWVITGEGDEMVRKAIEKKGIAAGYTAKPLIKLDRLAGELKEAIRIDKLNRQLTKHSEQAAHYADKVQEQLLANGSTTNGK